ncbi:MAG TPA: CUAEP/CCAEP-tail radical SAM protein, partial [Bryobacteraceae bacterium]|nr:CUAEP/CCAEP-tail radical SAM protein [Bryobacteraceae bacterium]
MKIVLISTYELGRQPFGLASPAAWLRADGHDVTCVDLACGILPRSTAAEASLIAFHLPMHTATRLAIKVIARVRALNPAAHL